MSTKNILYESWTKEDYDSLMLLGNYYHCKKQICEELYTTGTTLSKVPTNPDVEIEQFIKPVGAASIEGRHSPMIVASTEGQKSIKQFSKC